MNVKRGVGTVSIISGVLLLAISATPWGDAMSPSPDRPARPEPIEVDPENGDGGFRLAPQASAPAGIAQAPDRSPFALDAPAAPPRTQLDIRLHDQPISERVTGSGSAQDPYVADVGPDEPATTALPARPSSRDPARTSRRLASEPPTPPRTEPPIPVAEPSEDASRAVHIRVVRDESRPDQPVRLVSGSGTAADPYLIRSTSDNSFMRWASGIATPVNGFIDIVIDNNESLGNQYTFARGGSDGKAVIQAGPDSKVGKWLRSVYSSAEALRTGNFPARSYATSYPQQTETPVYVYGNATTYTVPPTVSYGTPVYNADPSVTSGVTYGTMVYDSGPSVNWYPEAAYGLPAVSSRASRGVYYSSPSGDAGMDCSSGVCVPRRTIGSYLFGR